MSNTSHQLWSNYHDAINSGNVDLAKRLLRSLQSYSSNPPPAPGGCAKCRKRLY